MTIPLKPNIARLLVLQAALAGGVALGGFMGSAIRREELERLRQLREDLIDEEPKLPEGVTIRHLPYSLDFKIPAEVGSQMRALAESMPKREKYELRPLAERKERRRKRKQRRRR